jgi:hypothetical protein
MQYPAEKEAHVETRLSSTGRSLWLRWTLYNTVGAALGMFVGIVGMFVVQFFCYHVLQLVVSDALLSEVMYGCFYLWVVPIIFGVAMGISQSLILRQWVSLWGWLTCSALGWGVVLILVCPSLLDSDPIGIGVRAAALGVATGVVRWFILRKRGAQAGWWVLASAMGWGLCWIASVIAPDTVSEILEATVFRYLEKGGGSMTREGVRLLVFGLPVSAALGGLIYGILTGAVLTWILRHPSPKERIGDERIVVGQIQDEIRRLWLADPLEPGPIL